MVEALKESIQESYKECLEEKYVLIDRKDGILYLTFNRPKISNGLTNGMYLLVSETLEKVNEDDSIRVK